jgi:SAM-dependent methyltransferase
VGVIDEGYLYSFCLHCSLKYGTGNMSVDEYIAQCFRCPDDGGRLHLGPEHLRCEHCEREFARLGERVFDLKSLVSKMVNSSVQEGYEAIHAVELALDVNSPGWGDLDSANPGKREFVKHERANIAALLGDRADGVVVDVSGGVGNYSSFLADRAQTVIHCELHVPSFAQACREHAQLQNLFFAHSDYLALPLADGHADGVVCTDTLIRGIEHERALLSEIRRILKSNGRAVVDFHHLRFQRIQKRSPLAKCYALDDFLSLVAESGFTVERVQGIGYVPTRAVPWEWAYSLLDKLFQLFVSPSRYLLVLSRLENIHGQ